MTSERIERTKCDACGAVVDWRPDAKEALPASWHDQLAPTAAARPAAARKGAA